VIPIAENSIFRELSARPVVAVSAALALLGLLLLTIRNRRAIRRRRSVEPEAAAQTPKPSAPIIRMDALDREFLPAALELFETPPSPIRIAAIWLICAGFTSALAWSYFGWLEIYAVAQGRIQPNGRSKIVQPLEPGKVIAIAVENGSRVFAGDVLLELDS